MNTKTLANFHRFGKIGKMITTILMVLAIFVTAASVAVTIYSTTFPMDTLKVQVSDRAEFRIDEEKFDSLWGFLVNNFSYAGSEGPEGMLSDGGSTVTPPEDQDFQVELSFFNQSYSSARVYSDGDTKVIEAESTPAAYPSEKLVPALAFLTLLAASEAVTLFFLRKLFTVLEKSESPFCEDLVKKLKAFGFSLLPVALFSTMGETLSNAFLSAGRSNAIRVQWGVLIAFAVTMCLVTVFRYGVQLQKESDETL